jgi:hypothetical protein
LGFQYRNKDVLIDARLNSIEMEIWRGRNTRIGGTSDIFLYRYDISPFELGKKLIKSKRRDQSCRWTWEQRRGGFLRQALKPESLREFENEPLVRQPKVVFPLTGCQVQSRHDY